jgi:nucleoside-diphosphate-sugar epimerase
MQIKKNVLIVGGAGYVGGYLTDYLIGEKYNVRVFDKLLYEDSYLKKVDFIFGDILDFNLINKHLDWADVVIWLSALVGDPACALNPALTMKTNVDSVKNLVSNFRGRIIFLSTCSVYGAQDGLLDEESSLNPLSLYAESKILAEKVLIESGSNSVIFRLGTLFGLSDQFARLRADLVLNVLTIRATLENKMSVFGGHQFRPLLHVKDVSTAILPNIVSSTNGIFNLHTENINIIELARLVNKIVPSATLEISESSFQDSRNYMVSSNKASKLFGFTPKYTLMDGIKEVHEVILSKRIPNVRLPRFSNAATLESLIK